MAALPLFVSNLVFFLVACTVLVVSGGILVRTLSTIAAFLRMREFALAFILMAFSTSLPELFVGVQAALVGRPSLSLGNVIGSNIANVTLVAGLVVVLAKGMRVSWKRAKTDAMWVVALSTLAMVLMFIGGQLSRIDGVILLVAFCWYGYLLLKKSPRLHEIKEAYTRRGVIFSVLLFIVGIAGLLISSKYVVEFGSLISINLGLPAIFVGLFFVALGTSLPELVFSVRAVMAGHPGGALGNILGSCALNSTLILGVTALITPIRADFILFLSSAIFMLVVLFLFATFIESGNRLTIAEGMTLVFMYVLFLIVELTIRGVIPSVPVMAALFG